MTSIQRRRLVRLLLPAAAALSVLLLGGAAAWAIGPTGSQGVARPLWQTHNLTMMIVYAAVALLFSFLCSVAEAVMLSVTPSFIANLKNAGKRRTAALLDKLRASIDRSLAAILTLNTIAHTVGAGGAGAEAAAYFGDRYVGIAMAVLTLLILFLSEIIPKTLGALYWPALAPITARFVQVLIWTMLPLIWVSELLTRLIARGKKPHQFSRDEFAAMVDIGRAAGQLDATESRILNNLFRFPELCAEDIMTPRTVVFALQRDLTVAEVMEQHKQLHFTRIPLYGKHLDDVVGFVIKSDILLEQYRSDGQTHLRDLERTIRGVHGRTPLSTVLEDLLDNRSHLLLVVDDYGGTEGLVTLEDVVESLIGIEIVDEADTIDDMRRLARQKWEQRMKRVGIDVRQPGEEPEDAGKEKPADEGGNAGE